MVGTSAVKYKLMPESLSVDLKKLTEEAKVKITEKGGVFNSAVEEPIAFGLKALVIFFAYPENKEIDEVGNDLEKIPGVSSCEMIDYRRAIG
ncbi:MAG: elongation factor 1-beta [Candidatus Pacearchaeota archaeon]